MWQQIAEWVKWLFQLTHETRTNREDIKDLRQEVKELFDDGSTSRLRDPSRR